MKVITDLIINNHKDRFFIREISFEERKSMIEKFLVVRDAEGDVIARIRPGGDLGVGRYFVETWDGDGKQVIFALYAKWEKSDERKND